MLYFAKGSNKGSISENIYGGVKTFIAVTAIESKSFKTLKGAVAWMNKKGYK